jgi:hypothetical protein
LLNTHPICQSTDDRVPAHNVAFPGLPRTMVLVHQVLAIKCIVRRGVWKADMPGAPVPDEMGLGKTFISVAATMIIKLVSEKVVM